MAKQSPKQQQEKEQFRQAQSICHKLFSNQAGCSDGSEDEDDDEMDLEDSDRL
jgi:hypothetical protein